MKTIALLFTASILLMMNSCNTSEKETTAKTGISRADWGETDGKKVSLYTLINKNGVQVKISTYGGTCTQWLAPDKNGKMGNILLGFDSLSGYLAKPPYFGALIG